MNTNIKILYSIYNRDHQKKKPNRTDEYFISVDGLEITVVYLSLKFVIELLNKTTMSVSCKKITNFYLLHKIAFTRQQ